MKPKILLIISTMASALFIGSLVYAGGMGGGGMGGGMMGGGMGGGMMGGYGQGFSNPWQSQNNPNQYNNNRSDQKAYQDKAKETEQLRQEIREKPETGNPGETAGTFRAVSFPETGYRSDR